MAGSKSPSATVGMVRPRHSPLVTRTLSNALISAAPAFFDRLAEDPVALATVIVALSTLVLAVFTWRLAHQTKRLADTTAAEVVAGAQAERDRRSEVAASTADPLRVELDNPQTEQGPDGWPVLRVVVRNTSARVVTAVTATIRTDDPSGASQSPIRDVLPPGEHQTFRFRLQPFLTAEPDGWRMRAAVPLLRIDVESFGLLKQRVFQTFTFRNDIVFGKASGEGSPLYQSRLQIIPAHPGATATDIVANVEEGTLPPEVVRS